jgi:hypothetical protein
MSGFKIKPPKKPRKPSAKFLARKAEQEAARRETPPAEGGVRIYLDDDRIPPEGWTLVKSITALMEMLRDLEPGRLERLSLDWHLGSAVTNGHDAVERILRLMLEEPERFANLERVNCHSSDREEAIKMARKLEAPLSEEWHGIPFYRIAIGQPHR